MPRTRAANDQRLTLYLPDGAIAGRVLQFTETGLIAYLETEVPRDGDFRFTLHVQGAVIGGEVRSLGQEGPTCRLQFQALRQADQDRLAPLMEADHGVPLAERGW